MSSIACGVLADNITVRVGTSHRKERYYGDIEVVRVRDNRITFRDLSTASTHTVAIDNVKRLRIKDDRYLTEAEDGLTADWSTVVGACFMNPPYCRADSTVDPPIDGIALTPWIEKAWAESIKGATVVGVLPFSPQTMWFRAYVYGHEPRVGGVLVEGFHAAMEVRQLPYRVCFVDPDTGEAGNNANSNTCIVIWKPNPGYVGTWQPVVRYWGYDRT